MKDLKDYTLEELLDLQEIISSDSKSNWYTFLYHINHLIQLISATNDGVDTTSIREKILSISSTIE